MLYTIAKSQYGIIVMGEIPQHDLNALVNVWQIQNDGQLRAHPQLAQALGYRVVLGTEENLEMWAKEVGFAAEEQDSSEVEGDAPEEATADS